MPISAIPSNLRKCLSIIKGFCNETKSGITLGVLPNKPSSYSAYSLANLGQLMAKNLRYLSKILHIIV